MPVTRVIRMAKKRQRETSAAGNDSELDPDEAKDVFDDHGPGMGVGGLELVPVHAEVSLSRRFVVATLFDWRMDAGESVPAAHADEAF